MRLGGVGTGGNVGVYVLKAPGVLEAVGDGVAWRVAVHVDVAMGVLVAVRVPVVVAVPVAVGVNVIVASPVLVGMTVFVCVGVRLGV